MPDNYIRYATSGALDIPDAPQDADEVYNHENAPESTPSDWFGTIKTWAKWAFTPADALLEKVSGESLGGWALKGLDTPGRAARTLASTGSMGDAFAAVLDSEKATTAHQLREQYLGKGFETGDEEFLGGYPGAILNEVSDLVVGIVTDPLTYAGGIGVLSKGGLRIGSAGRQAAKVASNVGREGQVVAGTGKMFEAMEGFKTATGKDPNKLFKNFGGAAPGLEDTVAGRLRAGEQHILQLHIPLSETLFGINTTVPVPILDKTLTPIIEAIAKGHNTASAIADVVPAGRGILKSAQYVKDFFFNPEFAHAGGVLQRVSDAIGNDEARVLVDDIMQMQTRLNKAGLRSSQYGKPMTMLVETLDKSGPDMKIINEAGMAILKQMPQAAQDAILKEVNEYSSITKRMHDAMIKHGVQVDSLGDALAREVLVSADQVRSARAIHESIFTEAETVAQQRILDAEAAIRKHLSPAMQQKLASPPPLTKAAIEARSNFVTKIKPAMKMSDIEHKAVIAVADAHAQAWADLNKANPEDWYLKRIKDVENHKKDVASVTSPGRIARARVSWDATGEQAIIKGFKAATVGSALHELGHIIRKDLPLEDLKIIEDWAFGGKGGMWLRDADKMFGPESAEFKLARDAEELFANGFTRYLQTGQAPVPKLQAVFQAIRGWLTKIYRGVIKSGGDVGARIEMSPEVKAVFDRTLVSPKVQNPSAFIPKPPPSSLFDEIADAKKKLVELKTRDPHQVAGVLGADLRASERDLALLENELATKQALKDNSPNWVAGVVTSDALHGFLKEGGHISELYSPEVRIAAERTFKANNGRPLSTTEVVDIVQKRGTDVTAFKPIKGTMSIKQAISAYRHGGIDEVNKSAEAIGKFFEVDPLVAIQSRFTQLPSAISKAENIQGAVNIWGRNIESLEGGLSGWVDMGRMSTKHAGTYVPAAVYEGLVGQWNAAKNGMAEIAAPVTAFNKTWKAFTTATVPVFHLRNKIGNIVRRLQMGAVDLTPVGVQNEYNIHKLLMADSTNATGAELAKIKIDLGGHGVVTGDVFLKMAREEGALGTGAWSHDVSSEFSAQSSWLNRVMKGEMPLSRQAGKTIGGVFGFKSGGKGLSFEKAGNFIESSDRAAAFATFMRKGETSTGAAYMVDKTLYNYQNVSPAVQIARRNGIYPFAAWSAKNIPAQIEIFLTRPGQFAAMLHAKNAIEQNTPGVNRENLPRYIKDKFNIVVGKDADGKWAVFDPSGVLPLADLPDIAGEGGMREFFTKSLGPLPRVVAHRLFNVNTFTLRDIERVDGEVGLMSTPVGQIPMDIDTGYDVSALLPRMPGTLTRFSANAKAAEKTWLDNNFFNPLPVRTYDEQGTMKADLNYYKDQMIKSKSAIKQWRKAGNAIMEAAATQAYIKHKNKYQQYLSRNAPKQNVP